VFPGAEGYGTQTTAGRGGRVIPVTTLADGGPGSLRDALEQRGRRIIVFRVGGVIELRDLLFIRHPFVTVAGQTAPGDGILLKNFGLIVMSNDVLIQHIRVRPGNEADQNPTGNDAIQIFGPHGDVAGAYNVVIDHVSASWGEDETISTWFGARDITISWSIFSEALHRSRHPKRTHSAGMIVGDRTDRVSVHHNLLAHNDFRNPLFIAGGRHDFVNNVVYDWGTIATEIINDAPMIELNFVGNTYIPGPSLKTRWEIILNAEHTRGTRVHMRDNVTPSYARGERDDWALYQGWDGRIATQKIRAVDPIGSANVTATPAGRALEEVLLGAGATRPGRDAVDERIIRQVRERTGAIIDSPEEVGGYPAYRGGTPPIDSDNDGMPDAWERAQGLATHDPSDAHGDPDGDGYTNVEEYLHALSSGRR
jgi:pectate lyase